MKRFLSIILSALACTLYNNIYAQTIEVNSEGRDASYVASITSRSEKNISSLELAEPVKTNVQNLVINRYFELNDIYAERDTLINQAKRNLTGDEKNRAIDAARSACDSKLYRSHFAFPANLGIYLSHEQIIAIFDAMTYNKVQVTYDAYCDMIPSLTAINNCVIEADYSTNPAFISMYGASTGTILNFTVANSTLYNLQENASGYFLRLSNASNATPQKIYGPAYAGRGGVVVQNSTFVRMLSGTHWFNNYPQSGTTFTLKKNVFYDTYLLQKAIRNNTADFTVDDNVIWGVSNEVDATDKGKFATEDDPGMTMPSSSAINFGDPYYGLKSYFTPTKGIAAAKQFGDPRYFE